MSCYNVFNNGALRLNFPIGVEVMGYANDLAVIATTLTMDAVEIDMTTALRSIQE